MLNTNATEIVHKKKTKVQYARAKAHNVYNDTTTITRTIKANQHKVSDRLSKTDTNDAMGTYLRGTTVQSKAAIARCVKSDHIFFISLAYFILGFLLGDQSITVYLPVTLSMLCEQSSPLSHTCAANCFSRVACRLCIRTFEPVHLLVLADGNLVRCRYVYF